MAKLSKAMRAVLEAAAAKNGRFNAWSLGTRTCEALRVRGLVEGDRPFQTRTRDNGFVWVTDAGRRALSDQGGE